MSCFLRGVLGFITVGVIAAIAIPSYGDFTSRASLNETMNAVRPLRDKIAEALSKDPGAVASLAASALKEPIPSVGYLKIGADGTIAFRSSKHGQIIIFEPVVMDRAVSWKCIGSPPKDVPPDCR